MKGREIIIKMYTYDQLLNKIEISRQKLTNIALSKGFTHTEAIIMSQELDQLLNQYQKMYCK